MAVILGATGWGATGCGASLIRLAKDHDWAELDRQARAQNRTPRGKAARAWAQALVELDRPEQARAILLRDFRHGGQELSLLALAELELKLGLRGIAAAHYTRLITLDLDTVQDAATRDSVCDLLRERAQAEAALGEALAADLDMRRVALVCPAQIDDQDRGFLAGLRPHAQAQVEGQRTLSDSLTPTPESVASVEAKLRERLEAARKRSPRAIMVVAEAERIQLEPDDIAVLLAAEFAGALGPGFIAQSRLSAWVGNNELDEVIGAIDRLPQGVREYGFLRLASVRPDARLRAEREAWIVAAMSSVAGQEPQESAKSWRVAASVGDLSGAEFALNTDLRDLIPIAEPESDALVPKPSVHWSRRVPVDRRSFDLLLSLARLLELREQPVLALELRRSVIGAGYELGLAQVGPAAAEEVMRQLALGRPWQALALAEVVPGPLVDEILPALASSLALARAAGLDDPGEALAADRNAVWRALGDPWFEIWEPRLAAGTESLDLRRPSEDPCCPELGDWLASEHAEALARVGLDPEASRAALEAAFTQLDGPETGVALARAIEADVALACSAPLVALLGAGLHALTIEALDERLVYAPELSASMQLQLHAELAIAHGADKRALMLTTSAAAQSVDPRALWARAAIAGRSVGAREYTLEALRQVVLHSDGLDAPVARREMLLILLRDVDADDLLREGDPKVVESIRDQLKRTIADAPVQRQWARLDALLWALASEPRADAQAWSRLLELLEPVLQDEVAARHPAAIAALQRAAASDGAEQPVLSIPELAYLSDADALCDQVNEALARANDELDAQRLIGASTACGPQTRAEALAALSQLAGQAVRAPILAGPIAAEIEPERPGVLRSVPALAREGLGLRVAFNLPIVIFAPPPG